MTPPAAHYAALCLPSWGHCRPELTFAIRLLILHPHLLVTLFIPDFIPQPIDPDIDNAPLDDAQRSRLRVIKWSLRSEMPRDPNTADEDDLLWKKFADGMGDAIVPAYRDFLAKKDGDSWQPPDVILPDALLGWGFKRYLESLCQEAGVKVPEVWDLGPPSLPYIAG